MGDIKFLIVNVISSHEAISYFVIEIKFLSIKTLLTNGKLNNLIAKNNLKEIYDIIGLTKFS